MNEVKVSKSENQLSLIQGNLENLLNEKAKALPKNFNQTRFLQNCLVVLKDTKEIEKYDPVSIASTMIKGAFLDLDFFNGECYAIPYGNQLSFQTDYKGEIKLARKYSIKPIKDIFAKVVRKGDDLKISVEDGKQKVDFFLQPFNDSEIIGAFCVVNYSDGVISWDVMSKAEIEQVRKQYSKCPNSPAWIKSEGEMYKKTVMRRTLKLVELQFDSEEQEKAWHEGDGMDVTKIKDTIDVIPAGLENPFKLKQPEKPLTPPPLPAGVDERYKKMQKDHPDWEHWQIIAQIKEEDDAQ